MNINAFSLRDLEYAVAVADVAHFGKAAQRCHVSQPALSAQIKKVEDILGIVLFERSNRQVSVTERGRVLIEQMRTILAEGARLAALAKSGDRPLSGEFRLGTIATVGPYLLPALLAPFRKRFPECSLFLKEGFTDDLLQELRQGDLDALIASRTFDETGFRTESLFHEPLWLAVPADHPLAHKEKVSLRDLRLEDMVLLSDGNCLRDQTINLCPSRARQNPQHFYATSMETLRQLIASGMGYSLMPQLAVKADPRLKGLVIYRELNSRQANREIILVTRERFARMDDIEALATFIREQMA